MKQGSTPFHGRAVFRVAMLIGTVLVAAAAYQAAGPHRDPRFLAFLGVLEGSIVLAWIGNSIKPHPVLPAAMAAAGLAGLAASNGPIAGFGVFMALVSAGARFPVLYGALFGALLLVLFEVIGSGRRSPPLWIGFEALGFTTAFLGAVGLRQVRGEQARTRAALTELEELRELQVRAARVAERVRLAGEIHDILGQTLSALTLQVESARLELAQPPGDLADPAMVAALGRAHRLAREAMEEARSAVGTLRGDPLPGPALLANLVSDFEREHGTEAHLRVEGKTLELAPAARLAIYRAAEEALANLGTHAPTGQVEVRLRYRADGAELTVESDAGSLRPPGSDEQSRPPSTGGPLLDGVRERAELLGGHLEIAHTEQGFRVRLWLPTVGREYYPEGLRDEIPASAARERGDTEAALNRQS